MEQSVTMLIAILVRMTVCITGAAGFIGFHLAKRLLLSGCSVVGIDSINSYYDPNLKLSRLNLLRDISSKKFCGKLTFIKIDLTDADALENVFSSFKPSKVVNLAAQAGVRYSLENPKAYIDSNIVGFMNLLESCRSHSIDHFIYASSSSVYGLNASLPFSESNGADHPLSLYAATKKSNELIAHTYSHLFGLPATGLRFFTVYGPWGRPDMALFLFTKAILDGKPIQVFNYGQMMRDFTYIDDIIESLCRLLNKPAEPDPEFDPSFPNPCTSLAPHRIFNIGNSSSQPLDVYISAIERSLGMSAIKEFLPMQPGDVEKTAADTSALEKWIGFKPHTSIEFGINQFVAWYRSYYSV